MTPIWTILLITFAAPLPAGQRALLFPSQADCGAAMIYVLPQPIAGVMAQCIPTAALSASLAPSVSPRPPRNPIYSTKE